MTLGGKMSSQAFDKKVSANRLIQILAILMALLAIVILVNGIGLAITICIALSVGVERFSMLGWILMVANLISPIHLVFSWKSNFANPWIGFFMHALCAIGAAVSLCCMMVVYGQGSWQAFVAGTLVVISTFGAFLVLRIIFD
ncbi:MAG TPA: hypothetical protein PLF31_02920 [Candidatus Paceibacterota bacterium]|nr:hypothetical protein [Candidatus Paceibacterota bacterium]